ncbi:L-aspartate oxidase [candidate division WOR-3 bacterium]|uniref:L-aspartate oxidase n=1 Tax=candidate division WOR-3 bacterium TaxID=2052148 RepID=A0A9D5QCX4_UNCW3|nr:L-aspartate oxidase [candidate division WOR-3 bacterium]MBD3364451.1 L-aspartate oxidase [candidate division WOR-3 bacterium]
MPIQTDYLVVGSGMAGLWFAYRMARHGKVIVLTKKDDSESNTNYAQGGIAAAVGPDDSPEIHMNDTIKAGYGLCKEDAVRVMTKEGPGLVRELDALDIDFSENSGRLDLGIEGGHTKHRVIHAADTTGQEIEWGLIKAVRSSENITLWEHHFAVDLLKGNDGNCCGIFSFNRESGEFTEIRSKVVMLATGGLCGIYEHTTNPPIATGDGVAMAWRTGAEVENLEFIQFHPTSFYGVKLDGRAFLISEAVRGEGALLRTPDGTRFMPNYHPDAEMAPRSDVARAIYNELRTNRLDYVLLDLEPIPDKHILKRFPMIAETCRKFGIDITRESIPVVPAAHYSVGGIKTNLWGQTSIKGLYAAGECAHTGVHGANRLASNSLLEALVFADRASRAASDEAYEDCSVEKTGPFESSFHSMEDPSLINSLCSSAKQTMWRYAGIVRSEKEMKKGRKRIAELRHELEALYPERNFSPGIKQLRNMLIVGDLILRSAIERKESRGLHYVEEYPDMLPEARHTVLKP